MKEIAAHNKVWNLEKPHSGKFILFNVFKYERKSMMWTFTQKSDKNEIKEIGSKMIPTITKKKVHTKIFL